MKYMRRGASLVGTGVAGLALFVLLSGVAEAQINRRQPRNVPVSGGSAAGYSSVRIIENADFRRIINVGRDCIKDKDWDQAVQALQTVLNEKKDYYVKITDTDPSGKIELPRWTSVKFEANNLIGSMPDEGLDKYEFNYGKDAKDLLDEAKSKGDRTMLADVAQRYCHTKAGIEANELVATMYLARGQVFSAALRFEKLLAMNPERTKLSELTLFKAALAFKRAGDTKNYEETRQRLETSLQGKKGLQVGDNVVALAKLNDVFALSPGSNPINVHDWRMIRGNVTNTAQANGSPPLLDIAQWRRPLFMDKTEGFNDQDQDQQAQEKVKLAISRVEKAGMPVLPGFYPIAAQGIMVYRSHRDIRAVALRDIEIKDEDGRETKIKKGEILWKVLQLDRSLSVLLDDNKRRVKTENWIETYDQIPGYTSFLYDNSLIGTLSTDNRLVYAINDLAVPPPPVIFQQFAWQNPAYNPQELKSLLMSNELHAYELASGKRVWDINHEHKDFKDSHFLSQPISVGGKLYVLNERVINVTDTGNPGGGIPGQFGGESELRLVCIDPTKVNADGKPQIIEPIQVLGNIAQYDRFLQEPRRRMNAVHLGFGEGILVCPTNAGEVFGIDLMTRSLVWSYPYRGEQIQPLYLPNQQNMGMPQRPQPVGNMGFGTFAKWKSAPPAIQDGKVVFTAWDADSIHCINLRDGKPVWKRSQSEGGGDQYMAGVFQGRVLIVGKNNIRALSLKDGTQLWSIYTGGMPSGQGVASKGVYYLPLNKKGEEGGEILAIDIERGQIKAHNGASRPGAAAPGNLVFYEGMVLSQTPTEIVAYPQLVARLETVKQESTREPNDLAKTTEYGELLLKDGQIQLAVETLMKVYDRSPADPLGKRVKDRLFEALTEMMQVDFPRASKDYLTIYQALCAVPGNSNEEQTRKAKYYRLVGQGREAEGNLVEAFQMYKDFGALPIHRDGGIASPEDPSHKIPVNVWLRGRIAGMFAKATPVQKQPLEAKIAEEWKVVEAQKNPDLLRSFVGMFDVPFKVGREARIRLAETIMERNDRLAFLEAELYLQQVLGSEYRADPQTGGRALAGLAHLEEKKGTSDSMRLAASYKRELGRDFANTPVWGTKTGMDLLNELATDKRYLPFLEDTTRSWGPVKIGYRTLANGELVNLNNTSFVMTSEGDQTPFARQHQLLLDPSNTENTRLILKDTTTNLPRWDVKLDGGPVNQNQANQSIFAYLYQSANSNQPYFPNARFRFYHVRGHLIVCQVGTMVYGLDGDSGRTLWKIPTVENTLQVHEVRNDREGNPELMCTNQFSQQLFKVGLGRIGATQASYVAILGHGGLTVVDPLRGQEMWRKSDVAANSHVFGDDQYLFLVEGTDNGTPGAARTLRAADGEVLKVEDFSGIYQARVRVLGRQILAGHQGANGFTLRLYDILSGKDVWSKVFPNGTVVVPSEDPAVAGIIDPNGVLTVVDAKTGKDVVQSSLLQFRINAADLKGLKDPFLLSDAERFYIALNKPIDGTKIGGGLIYNNISNGTRCLPVNGWFVALQRQDGEKKTEDGVKKWRKGDFAWHPYSPIHNQMLVVEDFEQSPIVLFTARYMELAPNVINRWVSVTESLNKATGKMIFESGSLQVNGPMYTTHQIDMKSRTINLVGFSQSVQHYVDEGKGPPPIAESARISPVGGPGTTNVGLGYTVNPFGGVQAAFPPVNMPFAPVPPPRKAPAFPNR